MSGVRPRRWKMYKLYVRRTPCEKWSFWATAKSLETLIANIQVIERYGWQWKVKDDTEQQN